MVVWCIILEIDIHRSKIRKIANRGDDDKKQSGNTDNTGVGKYDIRISEDSRVAGGINNIELPSDVSEGSGGK